MLRRSLMILNWAFAPCGAITIAATATIRTHGVFSPLTPALSPQRGEGDTVMHRLIRETFSAIWVEALALAQDNVCGDG
ncbi:MAG: hypothetical protein L0Z50_21720, partial [Verrucomicrobiales bacterium]|nr:hypothetical protein [Verrucomicrobiales bacterium]